MQLDIVNLKMAAMSGLLENVYPQLRAVSIAIQQNVAHVHFYNDGEISQYQKQRCEAVINGITGYFSGSAEKIVFITPIIRMDYPARPSLIGFWVYHRYETYQSDE